MKDHKMQKKCQGRLFTQSPSNDRNQKLSSVGLDKDSASWSSSVSLPKKASWEPKTDLGKKLQAARKAIEAAGGANMTIDDVLNEVRERRGGCDDN